MKIRKKSAVERTRRRDLIEIWGQNNMGMAFWSLAVLFSVFGAERADSIPLTFGCVLLFPEMILNPIQHLIRGSSRDLWTIARPLAWLAMAGIAVWKLMGGSAATEHVEILLLFLLFGAIGSAKKKNTEHMIDVLGEEDPDAMERHLEREPGNKILGIAVMGAFMGACFLWAGSFSDECDICDGGGQVEVLLLPQTFADLDAPPAERELQDFVCWNCQGEGEVPDSKEPWTEHAIAEWNDNAAMHGHVPAQVYMAKTNIGVSRKPSIDGEAWFLLLPPSYLEEPFPKKTKAASIWSKPRMSPFVAGERGERGRQARARAMEFQRQILANLETVKAEEESETPK